MKKRLGFDDERVRAGDDRARGRTYRDFPTYKKRFERLRPFFWLLYKLDRVPKSFYVKFCTPSGP